MTTVIVDATSATWNHEVHETGGLVMVNYWAPWCEPCLRMLPVIEELANVYTGKLKVVRLNVDDNSAIASTYRVSIVPTVMFFKGTQKLHEIICAVSKPDLERSIQSLS